MHQNHKERLVNNYVCDWGSGVNMLKMSYEPKRSLPTIVAGDDQLRRKCCCVHATKITITLTCNIQPTFGLREVYSVGSSFLPDKEVSQGYALKVLELRLALRPATSTAYVTGEQDASA